MLPTLLLTPVLLTQGITNAEAQTKRGKGKKPNVILILADDMGYAGVTCFGGQNLSTKTLDNLAAHGAVCTSFYANGAVSSPTRVSLMTGLYQQRTGLNHIYSEKDINDGLDLVSYELLPRTMKEAGYRTGIFGKWHLGMHPRFNPIHAGFDEYRGFLKGNIDMISHYNTSGEIDWWHNTELKDEPGYATTLINDYAVDFIRSSAGEPFFMFVSHGAIHVPLQGPNDKAIRWEGHMVYSDDGQMSPEEYGRRYQEMVYSIDEGVQKILDELDRQGIRDNTLIIFTSDNGAEKEKMKYPAPNGGFRGFKGDVYEGGIRVPAIFYYPREIKGGQVNNQTMLSMDIVPTIYDFAGIKNHTRLDGVSLKNSLLKGRKLPSRKVYWANLNDSAIREGDWKLVRDQDKIELFNIAADKFETTDLANDPLYRERAQKMNADLEMWWDKTTKGTRLEFRTVGGKER